MKNNLNNLLNFKDFDMDQFKTVQGKKKTKRTDTGLDILNEHHLTDDESRKNYIVDNIDELDSDWIEIIYLQIEKAIGVTDIDIQDQDDDIDDDDDDDDMEENDDDDDDDDDINDIQEIQKVQRVQKTIVKPNVQKDNKPIIERRNNKR